MSTGEASIDLTQIQGLDEELIADTSEKGATYLLVGERGGHLRVSASTRQLLRWVKAGFSYDELAEKLSTQLGRKVTPEFLEMTCRQAWMSLRDADEINARGISESFWLRLRLIPAAWVARVAEPLTVLFDPRVALALLAAVGLAAAALVPHGLPGEVRPSQFWGGYALFLLSLIFHELGHASACARYGARPSDIGFTMYLIYPAFYSNVTSAWQLRRWQRVIVDLGGNYFQYLAGAVFIVVYLMTGVEAYHVAVMMILYGSAFSLNPIFKFDGYWMMADALGVTNLGEQPRRVAKHAWRRLRGLPVEALPWPRGVIVALAVYTPLSFAFWGYFLSRLLPLVWTMSLEYPAVLAAAVEETGSGTGWAALQNLLVRTLILFIVYFMLLRLGRMVLQPAKNALTRWSEKQAARAAEPA